MTIRSGLVGLCMIGLIGCQSMPNESTLPDRHPAGSKAAQYNTQLGMHYLQRGSIATALDKLKKALRQDPNMSDAHSTIALVYHRLAEHAQARHHFEKALSLSPKSSEIHNNFGVFLCQLREYNKAIKHFLLAIDNPLYTRISQAYENAGLCAREIPDITLANDYFLKALSMTPTLPKSLLAMAQIRYQQQQYAKAKHYLTRYKQVATWTPKALLLAIKIAKKQGDNDAVASYILLLRGQFPDSEQAKQMNTSL